MYKTIVVHLSNSPSLHGVLAAAASLAKRMDAHLVGTAPSGVAEMTAMLALGTPMMATPGPDLDTLRDEAGRLLGQFEQQCREVGLTSFETRLVDTSATEALLQQSHYCDLLVAGQEDVLGYGTLMPARLPGMLVTRAARPVLLVPRRAPASAQFDHIMVAWNGSLGVSRSIALALPLIQRASKLTIAVCNPEPEHIDAGGEPGADLAVYLARHHGDVRVIQHNTDQDIDLALAGLAGEIGADLILAGAFGHSRLHDWVMGSTTRGLIARSSIPLLMTH